MSEKKKNKRVQVKLPKGKLLNDYQDNSIEDLNPVVEPDEVFNPNDLFNDSGQTEQTVIKELFSKNNPKVKTEIVGEEDKDIARLYILSKRIYEPRNIFWLKEALDELILLRISKDRKSRTEFVQANQDNQSKKQGGLFDRLLGQNGGLQ
jgi:hypothetical protein